MSTRTIAMALAAFALSTAAHAQWVTERTPNIPRVRSSGLGLAFCKLAVDSHGGRIWVFSREGEGSSFHIYLPLRPPAGSEAPAR